MPGPDQGGGLRTDQGSVELPSGDAAVPEPQKGDAVSNGDIDIVGLKLGHQGSGGAGSKAPPPSPSISSKRTREPSGTTPEAKKAKQEEREKKKFADAAKRSLTLYVRELDGSALSRDRYLSTRATYAHFVAKMITENRRPPQGGQWEYTNAVVRIPMDSEEDMKWIRSYLQESYLVQTDKEYHQVKAKVYVAYLRDRIEPELTAMTAETLGIFVSYFRREKQIEGIFELKMAAKTNNGKVVHLALDEAAEEAFNSLGCKIPFAGAGSVVFEERLAYVARIKELERKRMRPQRPVLDPDSQKVAKDIELVDLADKDSPEKTEAEATKEVSEDSATATTATQSESSSDIPEVFQAQNLERTGIEDVPRRSSSSPAWHEEVEHAERLARMQGAGAGGLEPVAEGGETSAMEEDLIGLS